MIGWNFPSNNRGLITGLNDAGIETFIGDAISSLAREINQNSLDAKDLSNKRPVEVHFQTYVVNADMFPQRTQFINVLESCLARWANYEKARDFFENAIQKLNREEITVLKISDYYTTGLTGSRSVANGNWEDLIKSVGASDKPGGAGGSFGIGKSAPFACTPLRTVFYSTKDNEGYKAFQGVAKLVTHVASNGETTQGTGYYGDTAENNPIIDCENLDAFFYRDLPGTDIYIFGFDIEDNWEEKITRSVLENFLVAILDEDLIVRVGNEAINSTALPDLIQKYFPEESKSNCGKYYQVMTSEDSELKVLDDFEGMGKIELRILAKQSFPKRVAMVRQAGMLISEKGNFQTPMKFAGVFRARGDEINEFLRSLEPPAHNQWQASRHKDPQYATKVIRNLNKWMSECVKEISHQSTEEEYDFDGMQQYLPDDLDDSPTQQDATSEENTVPAAVDLIIRQTKKATVQTKFESNSLTSPDGLEEIEVDADDPNHDPDPIHDEPNPNPYISKKPENANPTDDTDNTSPSRTKVHLKSVRAFCSDSSLGKYKVFFEADKPGNGFISLNIVGEVERDIAPVISAELGKELLKIGSRGEIGPLLFTPGTKQEITVVLANNLHCALEVVAHEN
jgi:hypothetical protein